MIKEKEVILISRHGRHHQYSPTEVNYRANLYALKEAGVTHILATTACGSLREEIGRGHLVVLDQFIDFTKHRINTYADKFENGVVHIPMAMPFDETLRALLYEAATELKIPVHPKGTVVTIEGPRFSTKAESKMFRIWGADVINMSVATEVTLANEIKIPYAAVAMSTDYDCWKEDEAPVSWDEIVKIFNKNAEKVKRVLVEVIGKIE
jgi:5'-methylthioadenosine phosphorylase